MPTPERALWRRVILLGLKDLTLNDGGTFHILKLPNSTMRKRAISFFTDPEGMFFLMAPKIGVKPEAAIDELKRKGLLDVVRNCNENEYWYLLIQAVGDAYFDRLMGEEGDGQD